MKKKVIIMQEDDGNENIKIKCRQFKEHKNNQNVMIKN